MRARSNTIYALDAEQYKKSLKELDDSRIRKRYNYSENITETQAGSDHDSYFSEEENYLKFTQDYKFMPCLPSFQEVQLKEESDLVDTLSRLNEYAGKQIESNPNFEINTRQKFLNLIEKNNFKINMSNFSKSELENEEKNCSNQKIPFSCQEYENIVKQNVSTNKSGNLKIILIGSQGVGKTQFKNLVLSKDSIDEFNRVDKIEIKPTLCLEYSKLILASCSVQILDTNSKILTSPMIKTYIKICQGFILIVENNNFESLNFIEKQIENIINFSSCPENIFLLVNTKTTPFSPSSKFAESLTSLCEKFCLPIIFNIINDLNIHSHFEDFLSDCRIRNNVNNISNLKNKGMIPISNSCPCLKTKEDSLTLSKKLFNYETKDLMSKFLKGSQ